MHTKTYQEHLREAQYCGLRWRILSLRPDVDEFTAANLKKFRIVRTRCHSKACASCQLIYYRRIRKKLKQSLITEDWRMFTLTGIHHPGEEKQDLLELEANFRKLRKHLKRKFPEFKYFAVKELSPDGNWHYHGLWNIYIPFLELVELWKSISGAHRVWLSKVRKPGNAVRYIFKYCFKSCFNKQELELLFTCDKRKFSYSKGLLDHSKNKNPYTSEFGIDYSVDELKEALYTIIHNTDYTIDDFCSPDYPYFEDLMMNLYYQFYHEHPPNLFSPVPVEKRFA